MQNLDIKSLILDKIKQNGGWVNCHAHIDRAYTLTEQNYEFYNSYHINEKWKLHDKIKSEFTLQDLENRMSRAVELMLENGVTALGSYLDADPVIQDKAVLAGLKVQEKYRDKIQIKFMSQTFKGVFKPESRYWFDFAAEHLDIIGGTPRSELGKEAEFLDIIMQTAKKYNKMVNVHVDELHYEHEKETELLCDKTMQYGLEGKVVAVHSISLSRQPKVYREKVYKKIKDAGLMIICCPTAWLDHQRSEELMPFHNSIFPVDEAIKHNITVALGTDNFHDYTLPFGDGDMWVELRTLAHACRISDIDELVKIATANGRKVLGLE